MQPKFPALPPASLRGKQRLKTKLHANESLMTAESVGCFQSDESGNCGRVCVFWERREGEGVKDTGYCHLHAVCILLDVVKVRRKTAVVGVACSYYSLFWLHLQVWIHMAPAPQATQESIIFITFPMPPCCKFKDILFTITRNNIKQHVLIQGKLKPESIVLQMTFCSWNMLYHTTYTEKNMFKKLDVATILSLLLKKDENN